MGLPEPSLTTITKTFIFLTIAKHHVIHHAVLNYAEKITIAFLISIHTEMSTAKVMKMKIQISDEKTV